MDKPLFKKKIATKFNTWGMFEKKIIYFSGNFKPEKSLFVSNVHVKA